MFCILIWMVVTWGLYMDENTARFVHFTILKLHRKIKIYIPCFDWYVSVGHCPSKQNLAGSIPGQGTCLGCRLGPQSERVWEATDKCFSLTSIFLSLSPSLPLSLLKTKRYTYFITQQFYLSISWNKYRRNMQLHVPECMYKNVHYSAVHNILKLQAI